MHCIDPYAAPHVQAVAPVVQGNGTVDYNGESKTTTSRRRDFLDTNQFAT